MGWKDRSTQIQDAGAEFPFVQWVNLGSDLEPRSKTGGFFIDSKQLGFAGLTIDDIGIPANFHTSSGVVLSGAFATQLTLCPLIKRFAWTYRAPDGKQQYSEKYVSGSRGKMQLLCRIKVGEAYSLPIMLTFKGLVTKDLSGALKAHILRVKSATRGNAPSVFFWMTLQADTPIQRGKGSETSLATPLKIVDGDFDPDTHYVGDHVADDIEANWAEYEAWAEKWGEGEGEDEDEMQPGAPASAAPPQSSPPDYAARVHGDAPAAAPTAGRNMMDARRDWSAAWNTAKGKGLRVGLLNNAWGVDEIDTATVYMNDAIAELDNAAPLADIQGYLDAALANVGVMSAEQLPF